MGYIKLETGEVFEGNWIGSRTDMIGEVVFNTSMTGYQEIVSDPSYRGQIMTFCYPLIGNYGINELDDESGGPHVSGVIIGSACESPSHYQAVEKLSERLEASNIPGLTDVDTRALVKVIRQHGTVKGVITQKNEEGNPGWKDSKSRFLVDEVSVKEPAHYENEGPHVVLVDYGYKKSILEALLAEGCSVTVVPYHFSYEEIQRLEPDGILLSNGPGDPEDLQPWLLDVKKVSTAYPTLGICLGHQLLALAYSAQTEKLLFGHRGGNHPVKDLRSGKVYMSAQNHGYVVVEESIPEDVLQVTFRNVNDGTVEGLRHVSLPIQGVQFHPEAHPGPSDTAYIFGQFIQQLVSKGETVYAIV